MDPLRLCLAFGPAAIYLLLLGAINLSRRPLLVSGTRDAAALGLALGGFIMIGPIELFFPTAANLRFPDAAVTRFGLPLAFYTLSLMLVLLLLKPRLVVYNISADQLRSLLAELVETLDPDGRWAGDSLALPTLGVQLHLDHATAMRNVSLLSTGPKQSHAGWRRLETALRAALGRVEVARNSRGLAFLTAGALIIAGLVLAVAHDAQGITQALSNLLKL
jgi:hypothetical protein